MIFYRFSLVLIIIFFTACSDKYQYIEIEECFIPVPKNYRLIEKSSEYTYSYVHDTNDISMRGVSVYQREKDGYTVVKNMIDSISFEILSERNIKGFDILETQSINSLVTDKTYFLLGNKSLIMVTTKNSQEVEDILDYCEQTKK